MGRIRSVHPGLFSDEAFVALSPPAQVLLIGLWTEADDQGVFEWKPVTLHIRLCPASKHDIDQLLAELAHADCIMAYEVRSRRYGAVRNFRKYQRPRRPLLIHPVTDIVRQYVALSNPPDAATPDEGEPSPTTSGSTTVQVKPIPPMSGIAPQMEEVGGRMEEGGRKKEVVGGGGARARASQLTEDEVFQGYEAIRVTGLIAKSAGFKGAIDWPPGWARASDRVATWLANGWDEKIILRECEIMLRQLGGHAPETVKYFEKGIAKAIAAEAQPLPVVKPLAGETVHVRSVPAAGGVIAAADRLVDKLREFNQPAPSDLRLGARPDAVRAIPQGRGE